MCRTPQPAYRIRNDESFASPLIMAVIAMVLVLATLAGCRHNPATPATPVPPGAINQLDATSFRVLSDAQAAINSVKADVANGTVTLAPAQKTVLNQIISDYDVAEGLAQAYHAGHVRN